MESSAFIQAMKSLSCLPPRYADQLAVLSEQMNPQMRSDLLMQLRKTENTQIDEMEEGILATMQMQHSISKQVREESEAADHTTEMQSAPTI